MLTTFEKFSSENKLKKFKTLISPKIGENLKKIRHFLNPRPKNYKVARISIKLSHYLRSYKVNANPKG